MDEKYQGMDPEDLDDEELESLEQDQAPKKKPVTKPKAVKKAVKKPEEVKKRYGVFVHAERIGIADRETGEIVSEGTTAVLDVLAEILERLERIETNLGSMMGGE